MFRRFTVQNKSFCGYGGVKMANKFKALFEVPEEGEENLVWIDQ